MSAAFRTGCLCFFWHLAMKNGRFVVIVATEFVKKYNKWLILANSFSVHTKKVQILILIKGTVILTRVT